MPAEDLEVKTDWDSHERSVGPVNGYYLALCACEAAEGPGRYVGYYKVCPAPPSSYWEAACLLKGCTEATHHSPQQALREAEEWARMATGNLPAPERLEACREARPFNFLELYVLGRRSRRRGVA